MRPVLYILLWLNLSLFSNLFAQNPGDEVDPFMGNYILGNSAEVIMQSAPASGDQEWRIFDYSKDPATLSQEFLEENTDSLTRIAGGKSMDIATGDLNGDRYDNIIAAWECAGNSIAIYIPDLSGDNLSWTGGTITILDSVLSSDIRVFTGDFDRDRQKEFVLAYHGLDGNVHIELYQTDSLLALEKITEIADYPMDAGTLFDLTAGDFNGDGLDEIVLIHNLSSDYIGNDQYQMRSMVKIYEYEYQGPEFIPHGSNEISVLNNFNASLGSGVSTEVKRLVIATGNLDGDSREEIVYGFEVDAYWWTGFQFYSGFYNAITSLKIDPSLNSVSDNENRKGEISHWSVWHNSYYYNSGRSMSLDCHDLNGDGIDEVVGLGSMNLAVFTMGENLSFNRVAHILANSKYASEQCHNLLAINDLDADTSEAQGGKWSPEIVYVDFTSLDWTKPGMARMWVYQPLINESGEITGLSNPTMLNTNINGDSTAACVLALGDFNGDAVRLGKPRLFARESVVLPTVILNAPPVHYDIINDLPYDINFSYNGNNPEFVSSYTISSSTEQQVETEIHSDWGVSASLSVGGSFLGIGAKTTLSAQYGEGFSKSELIRHTISIEQTVYARVDDEIYATVTDYSFWEYPVYFRGEHRGYLLAAIPYFKGNDWFYSKSSTGTSYRSNHEVGNILSYPYYSDVEHNPEMEELLYLFPSIELHGNSGRLDELTYNKFTSIQKDSSWDFGMSINSSVESGAVSLDTEAHYNTGEINTHKTSVGNEFKITIGFSDIDTEIGEVNYKVIPYAYRSVAGAIVIDYNIEAIVADPQDPVTWWQNNYSAYADPAFILPWLYDPEKGDTLEEESKRHFSKEITFNPAKPQPGDTVQIKARIHNYSLLDTDGPVTVRFYREDPDNGGKAIESIYAEKEVSTPAIIKSQGEAFVQMTWALPGDISEYTRIYAVIDPDNDISEIHENNNKAFVTLSLWGATPIEQTALNVTPEIFTLYQNYPNPFNPTTMLTYRLPVASEVELSIYNLLGQKIITLVAERQIAGYHQVEWHASRIASGVYYYRIEAGEFQDVKKMILLK